MLYSEEIQIFILSLQVAGVGVLVCLPFALFAGWILSRKEFFGKSLFDTFLSLPLVLPPVVTGYALLFLFSDGSILDRWFGIGKMDILFTWIAASLAAGIVSLPIMIRSIEVAFSSVDKNLEFVSRSLGTGYWLTFFKIPLPLSRKGIYAGIILAFGRAIGEFGATIVVAGNIPGKTQTLPLAIFTSLQTGDDQSALRYILLSVVLAFFVLIVHRKLINH